MGSSRDNRVNLSVFLAVNCGAQEDGNEHITLVSSFLVPGSGTRPRDERRLVCRNGVIICHQNPGWGQGEWGSAGERG